MYPDQTFPRSLIRETLLTCPECTKGRVEIPANTVSKRHRPTRPFESVSIDHFQYTTVRDEAGFTSIFSIRDEFSKFVTIIPVYTHTVSEAIHYLRLYLASHGQIGTLHFDNFFSCTEMNDFCENEGITPMPSPGYRPESSPVERVHRDLRKSIPLIMEQCNIPLHRWSESLHIAATNLNLSVSRITGYAPFTIIRGCLPHDRFLNQVENGMKKLWTEVYDNIVKNTAPNVKNPPKNKGFADLLEPGTAIWIHSGPKGKNLVPGKVVMDNGCTVMCKKDGLHRRFGTILMHKSKISRKIERPRRACRNIYLALHQPANLSIDWK